MNGQHFKSKNRNSKRGKGRLGMLIVLSIVMLLFSILVYCAQSWNEKQIIRKVKFTGLKYTDSDVLYKIVKSLVINKQKSNLSLEFIENILLKNPFIKTASVSFAGIDELEIEIEERIPVAFILDKAGLVNYIDENKKVFSNVMIQNYSDLPVITGIVNTDSTNLSDAVFVLSKMKESKESFIYNLISELQFNIETKSFNVISSDFGLKINFGRKDNLNEKILKLNKFWHLWIMKRNSSNIKEIDIRWKNQVVVI